SWMELSDYIPAVLCGVNDIKDVKRNVCAAGHKAMYNRNWGGLPDKEFLQRLAPEMADLHDRLYQEAYTLDTTAGKLNVEWAEKFGLPEGIPVAVGGIDAHVGAIGSGIGKDVLVKIIGTSTCDIMVYPNDGTLEDIPGVAGIVDGSVLPGYIGIEAGQSAVGDIFNWFIARVLKKDDAHHAELSRQAAELKAGQSGLMALDWNNGNRNVLADHNLTGLLVGQTLHTTDYEIYRALIEATAFGARKIIQRMEEYGVRIDKVVNCGGIAEKNPLAMQIYANILNRPMEVAYSAQTVALGAAILGAAVGFKEEEGFESVEAIQKRICHTKEQVYTPHPEEGRTYDRLYGIYEKLHDGLGVKNSGVDMSGVMKELLEVKRMVAGLG
ncbi:MAG: ribulokinase, partial [Calditrichia bacterium]